MMETTEVRLLRAGLRVRFRGHDWFVTEVQVTHSVALGVAVDVHGAPTPGEGEFTAWFEGLNPFERVEVMEPHTEKCCFFEKIGQNLEI